MTNIIFLAFFKQFFGYFFWITTLNPFSINDVNIIAIMLAAIKKQN